MVIENGETDRSLIANNLNTIFLSRFVSHETPGATAWQTTFKLKTGAYRVFGFIQSSAIGTDAMSLGYHTKDML
jgi:hypothetical protein